MSQMGEILGLILQEREGGERTIFDYLRDGMDSSDRFERRKSLKERLGLKGMGCCGAAWGFRPAAAAMDVREEEEEENPVEEQREEASVDFPASGSTLAACLVQNPATSGMNLATALAVERNFRAVATGDSAIVPVGPAVTPTAVGAVEPTGMRVSLMRLLEETDGQDGNTWKEEKEVTGCDTVCCVCMVRKKGAAFIPCGHTYCRVCSRELWLNRGSCPLCNRPINEILDIF